MSFQANFLRLGSACLVSFALVSPAAADLSVTHSADSDMRYFFVNGRIVEPDNARLSDNGYGAQGGFGFQIGPQTFLEGSLFAQNYETGNQRGTDFYSRGGGLDLVYAFGDRRQFTPFLMAGGGASWNYTFPKQSDTFTPYLSAGLGFVVPVPGSEFFKFRSDLRYIYESGNGGLSDIAFQFGLEVEYGLKRNVEVEKIVERVVEKPVEVFVEKPVERIVYIEKPDSDGDGVPDDRDLCPNTPPGARVDANGCVIKDQVFRLERIYFDFNSAVLRSESLPSIQQVARMLTEQKELTIEVAGHTDDIGSHPYNDKLSRERAASVMQALIAEGVASSRMKSQGYGKRIPIASNADDRGRQMNRRVEIRVD